MSPLDLEGFETELQKLTPAEAPPGLAARLMSVRSPCESSTAEHSGLSPRIAQLNWLSWFRSNVGLAPTTAIAVIVLAVVGAFAWFGSRPAPVPSQERLQSAFQNSEQVEIDHTLLTSFEAVANLSDGEPVRLRFDAWEDRVLFRDASRGIAIEQRSPRLEIVPVRLETY